MLCAVCCSAGGSAADRELRDGNEDVHLPNLAQHQCQLIVSWLGTLTQSDCCDRFFAFYNTANMLGGSFFDWRTIAVSCHNCCKDALSDSSG